ncbi:MAG: hypothetical protein HY912_09645 [Desulfomonile tiedjei]|uniref:Uncharacterized protein n=1 Tax=Desulfomonile tiedjei TaxID=2358 RepID=A0A9D6Z3N3_9BACT|nr:hypothetical protein [Desulfomonile tiedjei]
MKLSQNYLNLEKRATKVVNVLVPELCPEIAYFAMIMEAEPPGHAFPSRAWERGILNSVARFPVDSES